MLSVFLVVFFFWLLDLSNKTAVVLSGQKETAESHFQEKRQVIFQIWTFFHWIAPEAFAVPGVLGDWYDFYQYQGRLSSGMSLEGVLRVPWETIYR